MEYPGSNPILIHMFGCLGSEYPTLEFGPNLIMEISVLWEYDKTRAVDAVACREYIVDYNPFYLKISVGVY